MTSTPGSYGSGGESVNHIQCSKTHTFITGTSLAPRAKDVRFSLRDRMVIFDSEGSAVGHCVSRDKNILPYGTVVDNLIRTTRPVWISLFFNGNKNSKQGLALVTPKKPLKLNDGWKRFIAVAIEDEHDRYFTAPLDKAEQTQSFIGGLSVKINGKQYDAFYPRDGLCQCGKHYPTIKEFAFHLIRYLQQRAEHIEVTHDRARTPALRPHPTHTSPIFAVGDKLQPGQKITFPVSYASGPDGTITQVSEEADDTQLQRGVRLAVVEEKDTSTSVIQIWSPSSGTIAASKRKRHQLRKSLQTLANNIRHGCRLCGAKPGQACFPFISRSDNMFHRCRGRDH
jgi:hypothetical protein